MPLPLPLILSDSFGFWFWFRAVVVRLVVALPSRKLHTQDLLFVDCFSVFCRICNVQRATCNVQLNAAQQKHFKYKYKYKLQQVLTQICNAFQKCNRFNEFPLVPPPFVLPPQHPLDKLKSARLKGFTRQFWSANNQLWKTLYKLVLFHVQIIKKKKTNTYTPNTQSITHSHTYTDRQTGQLCLDLSCRRVSQEKPSKFLIKWPQ